jgi:prepilin-type N-terminal cleavage/methylation domain-containing protein
MRDACCVKRRLSRTTQHATRCRAFTLLELMVVVAIMAIVMTMGVPFMRTAIDGGKGMTRAVKDIQEACSHARAMAILQQTTTELVIRPGDGVFEVGRSGSGKSPGYLQHERTISEDAYRPAVKAGGRGGGFSVKLPAGIVIEGLGVNGEDWTEDAVARVRFYSNGTSDEMSVVLLSDQNERRNLWLEVVTGLPELETDPHKFKAR